MHEYQKKHKYLVKYYIKQKRFYSIFFLMFSANFICVVLHLKIHPAIHLNTSKTVTSLFSEKQQHKINFFNDYEKNYIRKNVHLKKLN